VRLNGKTAQLAVPEQLFHYPFLILDPAEKRRVQSGLERTGASRSWKTRWAAPGVEGRKQGYWAVDRTSISSSSSISRRSAASWPRSLQAGRWTYGADIVQLEASRRSRTCRCTSHDRYTPRAHAAVKPFDDKRVRQPCATHRLERRAAGRPPRLGQPGEHHHVSPVIRVRQASSRHRRGRAKSCWRRRLPTASMSNHLPASTAWELLAVQTMVEQWKERASGSRST